MAQMARICVLLALALWQVAEATDLGVNIGVGSLQAAVERPELQLADKVKPFSKVKLFKQSGDAAFNALAGKQVMLGVDPADIQQLADNPGAADAWVLNNVVPYASKVWAVAAGNEMTQPGQIATVKTAMENVHAALQKYKVEANVTTPMDTSIFDNTYPPSAATIRADVKEELRTVLEFYKANGYPFTVNLYPVLACEYNSGIDINYCLGQSGFGNYPSMYAAQLDAAAYAFKNSYGDQYSVLDFVVGETGWPSYGLRVASASNAATYINNILATADKPTPLGISPLAVHIFSLYDEPGKHAQGGDLGIAEDNFGIYTADGSPKA